MTRRLVHVLFVAAAAGAVIAALQAAFVAVTATSAASVGIAGYTAIRTAVVVAFAVFVVRRPPARERSHGLLALASCTVAMASLVLVHTPPADVPTAQVVSGDLVALCGGAWMLASTLALGTCFGILPEARGLVTRGPYSLVRHPLYLGELLACAGLLIAAPTTWNLALGAAFAAAQATRMRLEERALERAFPQYRDYAARTPRLVPRALAINTQPTFEDA
jgi:protein-S-isoprenylcysteine O-methyltransferase Ste14